MAGGEQPADHALMVRSTLKAYLWLAALWSCGALVHAIVPAIPEAMGLAAGLVAAAWFLSPVLRQVGAWLLDGRASGAAELPTMERPATGS
jgi:hypothetical protein